MMVDKWEKVLYKKQKFPDNYVDPSFLSDLRKNVNLYYYTWWEAFTGACFITHEIACTVLFVLCFIYMKENIYSISVILTFMILFTFLCYITVKVVTSSPCIFKIEDLYNYLKSGIVFLFFGYIFSPVLKTLTQTISTDTIYAMVVLMMIAHVMFQDYGANAAIVSKTLSLNSALFAAVCLASRLPTVMHTFFMMILSVDVFVILPLIRKRLKNNNTGILMVTGITFVIVLIAMAYVSMLFTILFTALCFFVNVLFPSLFICCQKYKENIFGPWDEAIVKS